MKKIIFFSGLMFVMTARAFSVNQPRAIGSVSASREVIGVQTIAQLNALTPDTTGQFLGCSDCTQSAICISSGSVSPGQWVILTSTGTFVGTTWSGFQHCR